MVLPEVAEEGMLDAAGSSLQSMVLQELAQRGGFGW